MIRKLKLKGFKSFADETEISFSEGINCIVGPNGCGKSNIVDALKWVVGTTSAKGMRADTIKDVIFKGSEGRRAARSAEVSLLIEGQELFSAKSSLTEVKRRINSKGESEFFINGRKVRLKEIQELFTNLGLGHKDYAFFEQGQIDRVLRLKPTERRALIEEAAGITPFKEKREATLKELEEAEKNLESVRGVIDEVAKNLRSLKSQAERAKKFKELRQKERELELSLLGFQLKRLRERKATLEGKLKVLREDRSSLLKEVAEIENSLEREREEIEKLTKEIEELSKELYEIEKGKKEASVKRDFLEREIERLNKEILNLTELREEKLKRLESLKREVEKLKEEERQLLKELGEKEREEKELKEKARKLEGERRKLEEEKLKKSRGISSIEVQVNKIQMDMAREEERGKSQKALIERIPKELNNIKREKEYYLSQIERVKGELSKKEEKLRELQGELSQKRREKEEIRERIESIETEIALKREELFKLKGKAESIKRVISQLKVGKLEEKIIESGKKGKVRGYIAPLISLIEVEEGYERVVESFLSQFGAGIVVEDFESVIWIGERIKGNGRVYLFSAQVKPLKTPEIEGAVRLIDKVKAKDSKIENLLKTLLYKVYYAEDPVKLAKEFPDSLFIDENLNALSGRYSFVGKFKGSSILELEKELKEVEKELLKAQEKVKELERERAPILEELREIEEEEESLRDEIDKVKEEIYKLKSKLRESEEKLKEVRERERELIEKEKRAKENLNSLSRKLSLFKEKIKELQEKKKELLKEKEEVEKRERELLKEIEKIKEEASKVSSKKGILIERLNGLKEKVRAKEGALKSIQKEVNQIEERIEKEKKDLEKAKSALESSLKLLSGVDETIEEIREELKEKEERRGELLKIIRGKEEALRQRKGDLSKVSSELKEAEVELAKLTVKEEELIKRVLELDSSLSEALELSERVREEEETKRELINLKERIDRIGSVNLLAIEEYEKVKERYGFILEQEKDLLNSIKDLKEAIKKLEEEIEKRFLETFSAVSRHFKNTVKRVFEGGSGKIYLNDKDISKAGLEIEVKPPGKKHSNINLLSGGERTLAAISFLYALYKVRPAPFLVLDEVDAALDDANTLRFIELLKQMGEETQVIIITHNKLTMEAADVIYGITMEVPGVSKVIGVSFESLV